MLCPNRKGNTNMLIATQIFSALVAAEFLFIMVLETFMTTSNLTAKTFLMSKEELSNKNVQVLFKNQGIYNGLLAVLVILAAFVFSDVIAIIVLMGMMILVAIYGAITSNWKIIFKQGGLPLVTLVLAIITLAI